MKSGMTLTEVFPIDLDSEIHFQKSGLSITSSGEGDSPFLVDLRLSAIAAPNMVVIA